MRHGRSKATVADPTNKLLKKLCWQLLNYLEITVVFPHRVSSRKGLLTCRSGDQVGPPADSRLARRNCRRNSNRNLNNNWDLQAFPCGLVGLVGLVGAAPNRVTAHTTDRGARWETRQSLRIILPGDLNVWSDFFDRSTYLCGRNCREKGHHRHQIASFTRALQRASNKPQDISSHRNDGAAVIAGTSNRRKTKDTIDHLWLLCRR